MHLYRRSAIYMDTHVSLQIVTDVAVDDMEERAARAFGWFATVEATCSRFEASSEVTRLSHTVGRAVEVSPMLFTLVQFSLEVARLSGGAFDPTLGYTLEQRGFNRNYRTGRVVTTSVAPGPPATYEDVLLDPVQQTVTLRVPLMLDLGAVAKGCAIDLAAKELDVFSNYTVEAGGDIYVGGHNLNDRPWQVGIRHPRRPGELIEHLAVTDIAVCTSGDYERPRPTGQGHHLVDPATQQSPTGVASATVIAPTAMVADSLSTAASILGIERGLRFLDDQGVEGLMVSPTLEQFSTPGFMEYRQC